MWINRIIQDSGNQNWNNYRSLTHMFEARDNDRIRDGHSYISTSPLCFQWCVAVGPLPLPLGIYFARRLHCFFRECLVCTIPKNMVRLQISQTSNSPLHWTKPIAWIRGDERQEVTVELTLCNCMNKKRFKVPSASSGCVWNGTDILELNVLRKCPDKYL